jgi:gliding motility-associated-like protein
MKLNQVYLFIYLFLCGNISFSQLLFYQDVFHGGVTGGGFSTGIGDGGNGQIILNIDSTSTIRKAFLLCNRYGNAQPVDIKLNSNVYNFNSSNQITPSFSVFPLASENPCAVHAIDITNDINPLISTYNINVPNQITRTFDKYGAFYLLIVYENNLLQKTEAVIVLNEKDGTLNVNYQLINLNPIDIANPVGLAIHSDIIWDTILDGSNIYVNNNILGLIGGSDASNGSFTGGGVKGHFYYENSTLFGLDDDTPNNVMSGTDGLADIKDYLSTNSTSFNINLTRQLPSTPYNVYLAFFLAYSTPCDTFSAALLNKDTTACLGESVQLSATGGQKYKWQPSAGLSCDTCANPIASPLESTTYTVRIFNNDSCSKVYPIRININQPKPDTITTERSICGEDNGKINVGDIAPWRLSTSPITYTINGDTVQGPEISNISPGNKELKITDANGCSYVDNFFIEEENITVSRIIYLSAEKGTAPLEITARGLLVNYISNHVFVWIVNGDTINTGNSPLNYTFDQPGEYELIHITYNQYPHCADTVKTIILVFPDFFAQIPNVFSPNADGINDAFEIKISNTQSISWQIKNRWGNLVSEGSKDLDSETQKVQLWNGENAADGVYFYTLTATDYNGKVYEKSGSVSLLR